MRDYVVVLNYNGCADTLRCVESLHTGSPDVSVVVVDNASVDGSVAALRARWPDLDVVENDENLGFAGGMNVGLRHALERGAGTVTVLNNDTVVPAGVIPRLAEVASRGYAVSPEVVRTDDGSLWFGEGAIEAATRLPHHVPVARLATPGDDGLRPSEVLAGACVCATAETWQEVGLFDERFFLNFEDSEWSVRARQRGVDLVVDTTVRIEHVVSASFVGPSSYLGTYYYARNGAVFVRGAGGGGLPHLLRFLRRYVVPDVVARGRDDGSREALRRLLLVTVGLVHATAGRHGAAPGWLRRRTARWSGREDARTTPEESPEPGVTVFLSHSGADSGAEQAVVRLLGAWPDDGPAPLYLLGEHGPVEKRIVDAGVRHRVVAADTRGVSLRRGDVGPLSGVAGVVGLVRSGRRLRGILREEHADVVVANSLKSLVYGWVAGRSAGVPVVWSLHDRVSPDYFPRPVVPVLRHVVPRLVDGVLVNSRSTLATIRPGRTPVLVAAPRVDLDPRRFEAPRRDVRKLVCVGRLAAWKGQDVFLRAFADAFAGTEAEAVLVGGALFGEDDYEQQLRDLARSLGIEHQVTFTGHVTDPWRHLVDADVLVHSSRTPEPFGQVVLEGMWARCAVVATRPGGPAEVVTDGRDGLLVPCDDVAAMASALRRLRDEPGLATALAEEARRTVSAFYDVPPGRAEVAWLRGLVGSGLSAGQA